MSSIQERPVDDLINGGNPEYSQVARGDVLTNGGLVQIYADLIDPLSLFVIASRDVVALVPLETVETRGTVRRC